MYLLRCYLSYYLSISVQSKLKLELKIWQDDFEKEHGHPPSDAEKAVMKDKFVAYQSVS